MPNSIDELDITKSVALIKLFKKFFNYKNDKFEYVEQLRDIRNSEYAHMLCFEMDDITFSTTVVRLEEIIRQLCDYDPKVSEDFLTKVEKVLRKDSCDINQLKSVMFKMLAEQTEELHLFMSNLKLTLKQ